MPIIRDKHGGIRVLSDTPAKPTAFIEGWSIIGVGALRHLMGRVSQHQRQDEFHAPYQRTSTLVKLDLDKNTAETLNTIYQLGERA